MITVVTGLVAQAVTGSPGQGSTTLVNHLMWQNFNLHSFMHHLLKPFHGSPSFTKIISAIYIYIFLMETAQVPIHMHTA